MFKLDFSFFENSDWGNLIFLDLSFVLLVVVFFFHQGALQSRPSAPDDDSDDDDGAATDTLNKPVILDDCIASYCVKETLSGNVYPCIIRVPHKLCSHARSAARSAFITPSALALTRRTWIRRK